MSVKTAAVIVISNEILHSGKHDLSPSKYLIDELRVLNYDIRRVAVIAEDIKLLFLEIQQDIEQCDILIIVGNLRKGIIYRVISKITSQELHAHVELENHLKTINRPYEKSEILAPLQAKLLAGSNSQFYPVVYWNRIFILNEEHVSESFSGSLKTHLAQYRQDMVYKKYIKVSKCTLNGSKNVDKLVESNGVAVEYSEDDEYKTFKISSSQFSHISSFEEKLQKFFEYKKYISMDDSAVYEDVYSCNDLHIRKTIENIEWCLEQYGLENVFVSFNGGKDCTVLLHLLLIVIRKKYVNYKQPLLCLYVRNENPFPEQDQFICQCKFYYNLEIVTIQSNIKDALSDILLKHPNYKACFMGTRRTDPFSSHLNTFQMTDSNWPQVLRASPLLSWTYADIWDYLLYYKVPYCKLYDMGYTSLGSSINTIKNPSLIWYDAFEDKEIYLPAYKLLNETKERSGRNVVSSSCK